MSYFPDSRSHFRDTVTALLDLLHYANKNELKDTTSFDKTNLAAKLFYFLRH